MNYSLRRQNYNYFVRYHNNVPYIYYSEFQPPNQPSGCNRDIGFFCYDFIPYNIAWDPQWCDNSFTHNRFLPVNNYLYPQIRNPPTGSYNSICDNNYSIRFSNKIKIIIPDDPVFSGTYIFDYTPNFGDAELFSLNWTLNNEESSHNLSIYNHPESPQNGKLLVSLNDYPSQIFGYPGYLELKTSLYKDENNGGAWQLEDAYAFPAQFIFTAVQSPCPCSGYTGTAWPQPYSSGIGHRLSVGFSLPIRWRHPYKDWIVVDKVPHIINDTIPTNYAIGSVFNDGSPYYSSTDQQNVFLNNSQSIQHTQSYAPGTASITGGYVSISTYWDGIFPICTGLSNLGFAFRSAALGLGYDKGGMPYVDAYTAIQGIGPFQVFDRYYTWDGDDPGDDLDIVDERPFFNKTPIKAVVDFTYSCRPGLPCFNLSPTTITPVSGTGYGCVRDYYTSINVDYLCDINGKPDDEYWIENNITSTNIIYSGISGILPTIYKYGGFTLDNIGNIVYDAYVSYDTNPIISIEYTGNAKPSSVRDWVNRYLRLIVFDKYQNGIINTNSIAYTNPIVDIYWNVNNNNATAYIMPSEDRLDDYNTYPTIMVVNAGKSIVNGKYVWNNISNTFEQSSPNNGFSIRLSYDFVEDPRQGWRLMRYEGNEWTPYYFGSGGVSVSPLWEGNNTNLTWSIPNSCYSGIPQAPQSLGKGLYIQSYLEDFLSGYYYFNSGVWKSINNPNVQIQAINANYFIGIMENETYNKYYMLYQSSTYDRKIRATSSNPNNYPINITNAKIPCSYESTVLPTPPSIATIDTHVISTGLCTLRVAVEYDLKPCSGIISVPNFTNKTITIGCVSGLISINNQSISAGYSSTYEIPSTSFNVKDDIYSTYSSVFGIENLLFIQGLTEDAAISGSVVLDWDTEGKHDLYIEYGMSSSLTTDNNQLKASTPIGVWVSNGYYSGVKPITQSPVTVLDRIL